MMPPESGQAPDMASRRFQAEICRAVCYENGLAVKALIALALVAAIVVIRLLGF